MKSKRITNEDIINKADSAFDQGELLQKDKLGKFRIMQQVKINSLQRDKERIVAKYGKNHPRVKKIEGKLKFNEGFMKDLDIVADRSKIQVPAIKKNSWLLHGRVMDCNKKGIKNLTVSLFDERKKWFQQTGYSCTNEYGYFSLSYSPQSGDIPGTAKKKGDVAEEKKDTDTTEKETAAMKEKSTAPLKSSATIAKEMEGAVIMEKPDIDAMKQTGFFITITDKKQTVLYRDKKPVYIEPGKIIYREIILDTEKKECTPPEPKEKEKADITIMRETDTK